MSKRNLTLAKNLLRKFEGLRLKAYLCPAGKWTIGYGQTAGVKPGMVWTEAQAEADLDRTVNILADKLEKYVRYGTTDQQFCALLSLAYNIGLGALADSTVLRRHNTVGTNYRDIENAFLMWVKATDKKTGKKITLKGLVTRRWAESSVYVHGTM